MADPGLPIGEVARQLGMDADTLRYYERRGVVPGPTRDASGRRVYGQAEVHLLQVLMHLKSTGMPLAQIAEFTAWVASDPAGVPERLALLQAHRAAMLEQIASWQASLAVIDRKIADYRSRMAEADQP